MYLHKEDVEKILEIMKDFPDASSFQLQQSGTEIGKITKLIVSTSVNGYLGEFTTEISGVENW
jgi:hypothetical protein